MKCETHLPSRLNNPGLGWISLDRKLAAAITKISHGETGRVLAQITTAALSEGANRQGKGAPCNGVRLLCQWEQRTGALRHEPPPVVSHEGQQLGGVP